MSGKVKSKDIDMELTVNQIVNGHIDGPNFRPSDVKPGQTDAPATKGKDAVIVEGEKPYQKYGEGALRRKGVEALFRSKTGIGLDPEVAKALNGTMKEAALTFIKNPSYVNTERGGLIIRQLMSHVEGFDELGV